MAEHALRLAVHALAVVEGDLEERFPRRLVLDDLELDARQDVFHERIVVGLVVEIRRDYTITGEAERDAERHAEFPFERRLRLRLARGDDGIRMHFRVYLRDLVPAHL